MKPATSKTPYLTECKAAWALIMNGPTGEQVVKDTTRTISEIRDADTVEATELMTDILRATFHLGYAAGASGLGAARASTVPLPPPTRRRAPLPRVRKR